MGVPFLLGEIVDAFYQVGQSLAKLEGIVKLQDLRRKLRKHVLQVVRVHGCIVLAKVEDLARAIFQSHFLAVVGKVQSMTEHDNDMFAA